jgi:1-acyl-sn-glycerol-3-phosphate acyltransferase
VLYSILKIPARIALRFYCRKLVINDPGITKENGPLLIAANHPNSFLDAILIATLFDRPVYSLVRGDVYTNRFYSRILTSLNMLPVYRISEGAENLGSNYETFEKCKAIFKQNGIVLIFSEGRCINEWKLRPLKKGTARLALSAWKENIPLKIIPTGINFSSFRKFGKNIHLNFASPIENNFQHLDNGKAILAFNATLENALLPAVYDFHAKDKKTAEEKFELKVPLIKKIVLFFPALAGALIISPLYFPVRELVRKKWNNDHFDSIVVTMLFLIFPFYLLLLTTIGLIFLPAFWGLTIPIAVALSSLALLHVKQS